MKNRKWSAHVKIHTNKVLKMFIREDQKDSVRSYLFGKVRRWGRKNYQIRHRRHIFWTKLLIVRLLKKKGVRYSEYFDD